MIQSFVAQLSLYSVSMPQPLKQLYAEYENSQHQSIYSSLLISFHLLQRGCTEIYLVINALDECSGIQALLEIINELSG